MSKQLRMACAVMDMLRTDPVVTMPGLLDAIDYDPDSIRQTLRVLTELGFAQFIGLDADGRTKRYVSGPKLRRSA